MNEQPTKPKRDVEHKLLYVLAAVIGIPFLIMFLAGIAAYIYMSPHDTNVSLEPRFSEIYNRTFTAQQDLFIDQWFDSKTYYLIDREGDPEFPKVAKGDKITVKKIILRINGFAGNSLTIFVEVDDPKFATINSAGLDAHYMLINYSNLPYSDESALFDPRYLRND